MESQMSHKKNYKEILEILIESFEKKLIEREPFIRMQLLHSILAETPPIRCD